MYLSSASVKTLIGRHHRSQTRLPAALSIISSSVASRPFIHAGRVNADRPVGMYTLYVIPGSHACRSAMLMLDHKQVPYRRVEFVTLFHPVAARLHGFDAGGESRLA